MRQTQQLTSNSYATGPAMVRRAPPVAIARVRCARGVPGGVKYMQEYMYPGGKILRAPSVYLGPRGRYYTDPRGDKNHTYQDGLEQQDVQGTTRREIGRITEGLPRRLVESNFLITINPNRKWGADGQDSIAKAVFDRTLKRLNTEFLSILKVPLTTRQMPNRPDFSGHYKNDALHFADVIESTDIKGVVEVGENQKRMHAHVVVELKHYSMIQIDRTLLKDKFLVVWNEICSTPAYGAYKLRKGPYVDVQLLKQKNSRDIVLAYMRKCAPS